MFLVEKQVGNQNFSPISLEIVEELIFEVPRSRALVAIAQNENFEKLGTGKFKLLLHFLSFSQNSFFSWCTGLEYSLARSSIFDLGLCSRFIPVGTRKIKMVLGYQGPRPWA